jgi:hypothetical protein
MSALGPPTDEVLKTGDAKTPPDVRRPGKPPTVPVQSRLSAAPPSRREAHRAPPDRPATASAPAPRPTKPTPSARPYAVPAPIPPSEEQPFPRIGVETELGGLFFLLNVGMFLGLYGDFTTPDEPGIALDPWDFVELLGRSLLGPDTPPDDAVWPLLAGLAGRRPRERPGRGFEPPSDWRIPADWLEPFDAEGEWLWSAANEKLRVVHPAGFPVVAVGLRGRDAQALLHRELRRYRVRPLLRRASLPRESRVPLRRWIGRLGAYAAARIQVALGDSDRRHAVDTVLRRRATVFTTETHVDVSLSLSSLAIEIRLAGLDRDPGWIPAAGRFVAFHFE